VSGAEPAQEAATNMCTDLVETYAALNWTLYTRGDYALAVASDPAPPAVAPAPGTAPTPHTVYRPVPVPQRTIEFRRIDGQWKIDRLLPVSAWLCPTTTVPAAPVCNPYGPANTPPGASATPAVPVSPAPR
jgi:hypothetical protein